MGSRARELSTLRAGATAHRRRRAKRQCLESVCPSEKAHRRWCRLSRLGRRRQNNYLGRRRVLLPPAAQNSLVRAGDELESRFIRQRKERRCERGGTSSRTNTEEPASRRNRGL